MEKRVCLAGGGLTNYKYNGTGGGDSVHVVSENIHRGMSVMLRIEDARGVVLGGKGGDVSRGLRGMNWTSVASKSAQQLSVTIGK